MLGAKITETWGQQVIVDNRPGANGIVASSPEEFATYLKSEIAKWSKVARAAHVTLD